MAAWWFFSILHNRTRQQAIGILWLVLLFSYLLLLLKLCPEHIPAWSKIEDFPGEGVYPMFDICNLLICIECYICSLWYPTANHFIDILICSTFPAWIRMVLCQDLVQVKMSFSHSNLPAIPKLPVDTIFQNHRVTYNRNDYEFVWYYKTFPSIQIPGSMHVCNCWS